MSENNKIEEYAFNTDSIIDDIKIIRKKKRDLNSLHLYAKNKKTGEISPIICTYVSDEIMFLFARNNEEPQSLSRYLEAIDDEASDENWNQHVDVPEGYVTEEELENDGYDEFDEEGEDVYVFSEEDMQEGRYEFVVNMPTRIFVGESDEGPMKNYNKSFPILDIETSDKGITLIY